MIATNPDAIWKKSQRMLAAGSQGSASMST
jgi:hypothetical protein